MATTINESYQPSVLLVPDGGFGVTSNTAYSLLAAGTTATGNIQSVGAPPASQIFVSGGASGLPTNAVPKNSTTMQLISTQTASTSSIISFTGLSSTYYAYKVVVDTLVPATTNTFLSLRFSSDNGSTYYSSAAQYSYAVRGYTEGAATLGKSSTSDTFGVISAAGIVNTANKANHFEVMLVGLSTSINFNGAYFTGRFSTTTPSSAIMWGECSLNVTTAINAFQFLMTSGNISTGTFKLYGILA